MTTNPMYTRNLGALVRPGIDPDREALVDNRPGGRSWTYRQLDKTSAALGAGLIRRGYRRGARIAIIAANSAEFLVCFLGIMRVGLVAVPVNFKLSAETVAFILEDCNAQAVFVDHAHAGMAGTGRPVLHLDGDGPDSLAALLETPVSADIVPGPDEIAEILYTSGSTGRPKGVPLSHAGQLWAMSVYVQPEPSQGETTLIVAPMYHMNALFNLSMALANGVRIVLLPRFDARGWLQAIADFRCTRLSGIPSMFAMAARERDLVGRLDLASVQYIMIGSAPLGAALAAQVVAMFPNAALTNGYGTTEAGPAVFGEHPDGLPRPPLSLGYPVDSIAWRLTGGTADEGVLEMKTPATLGGYLNLPEATAERIRDGWYASGDIMRRDADGFFYFVGRADDMFVCGGENVYPGEVEKLIERHPDVMQTAVVPVPDEIKGQIPIAFVVPAPGRMPDFDELKTFCLAHGPAYSHPRAFELVDVLPVAGTHKIDKRQLEARAREIGKALGRS